MKTPYANVTQSLKKEITEIKLQTCNLIIRWNIYLFNNQIKEGKVSGNFSKYSFDLIYLLKSK